MTPKKVENGHASGSSILDQLKIELEAKRSKIKQEFEDRKNKIEGKAGQRREKIEAKKKERDAKIAKIEKELNEKADVALRKHLGEEKYKRLQEWLLKRKHDQMRKLQEKFASTGNEDYENQLKELKDSDPKYLILTKYVYDQKLYDEMKKDVGFA